MISLHISELPDCSCGKGKLLPVEDFSKDGSVVYFKGWFCAHCNTCWLIYNGIIQISQANPKLDSYK